jgi:hypothetical protein
MFFPSVLHVSPPTLDWPDQDAVGRQIHWGGDTSQARWMTDAGVVGDVKQGALNTDVALFAIVALGLAAIGIYGVLANALMAIAQHLSAHNRVVGANSVMR